LYHLALVEMLQVSFPLPRPLLQSKLECLFLAIFFQASLIIFNKARNVPTITQLRAQLELRPYLQILGKPEKAFHVQTL